MNSQVTKPESAQHQQPHPAETMLELKQTSDEVNSNSNVSPVSIIANLRQVSKTVFHPANDEERNKILLMKNTAEQVAHVFESMKTESDNKSKIIEELNQRLSNIEKHVLTDSPVKKRTKTSHESKQIRCQLNEENLKSSGKFDILASEEGDDNMIISSEEDNSSSLDSEEKIVRDQTEWLTATKKRKKKQKKQNSSKSSTSEDDISDPEYRSKRKLFRKIQAQNSKGNNGSNSSTANQANVEDKSNVNNVDSGKNQPNDKTSDKKPLPPPPIKIIGVSSLEQLKKILNSATKNEEFVIRFLGKEMWKVNPSSETGYKNITAELNKEKIQWYSHSDKNLRNIKVMCRGLPETTDPEEIIQDLKEKKFKIVSAVCMQKRFEIKDKEKSQKVPVEDNKNSENKTDSQNPQEKNSQPEKKIKKYELRKIPLFQLDFEHSESAERIFNLKSIAHIIVKIEPIKINPKIIPQCKRCCGFFHTANFCQKHPRCVKCAGSHFSHECDKKGFIDQPKCANCGCLGHPASYRGCPLAKEFQNDRKKQLKNKNQKNKPLQGNNNSKTHPAKSPGNGKSFAQAVKGNKDSETSESAEVIKALLKTIEKLNEQISLLNKRLNKLESSSRK